jgi:Protein of unknown function (DUF1559)
MSSDDNFDADRPRRRRSYGDDEGERQPPPRKNNTGMILLIIGGVVLLVCGGGAAGVFFVLRSAAQNVAQAVKQAEAAQQQAAKEMEEEQQVEDTTQNLEQIGRALHLYSDAIGALPNNSYDLRGKQSRPLLSWRVHLLPYLNQEQLYKQFNLNEPWDSPVNFRLLSQMPAVYATTESRKKGLASKTYYRGFSHKGAIFEKPAAPGQQPPRITLAMIVDGTANTIFVVEAGEPIEWTKPEDLEWTPGRPKPSLGGPNPNLSFCMVLMVDGSVHRMRKTVPDLTLRWLIDRQDGNIIPPEWEE